MPENDELKKYLDYDGLDYLIKRIPRTRIIVTFDDVFAGETATCSLGTTTYTNTVPVTEPYQLVFSVVELGTWTIATSYLGDDYETTVEVTGVGTTSTGHVSYVSEIDGETVTPTDDITTWLKCANIEDASITTLADVLANRSLFETLIANSNACKYMARSTTWALAEGSVPTMTDYTTPSGEVIYLNPYSPYLPWKAFDGDDSSLGTVSNNVGNYIGYIFTEPKIIKTVFAHTVGLGTWKIQGRISGNWEDLATLSSDVDGGTYNVTIDSNDEIDAIRLYLNVKTGTSSGVGFYTLQFYEADITRNSDAMSLIGKYDYCSNELLSNATWASAIANSDYFEEVLNVSVPKMTSNTTPSGECICSSTYNASYPAWKAFDKDDNTQWAATSAVNNYIGYDFGTPIRLSKVYFKHQNHTFASGTLVYKVQGYNGTDWIDLSDSYTYTSGISEEKVIVITDDSAYSKFRLYFTHSGSGDTADTTTLQFYGRASSEVLVPLVPTMTSATTPSGEVSDGGHYNNLDNYAGWRVFNGGNGANGYYLTPTNQFNKWIAYTFTEPKNVKAVLFNASTHANNEGVPTEISIQVKVNDEWITLDTFTNSSTSINVIRSFNNSYNSTDYRVLFDGHTAGTFSAINAIQFYQRTVQTNIIHSAANDTIYMMNNGTQVPLCTTNSDGDGILDFTQFTDGTYTLYSSVAKDLTDLSNDYSKSVRITKTSYGCTTEAYLMPDILKTSYWFGNKDDRIQALSTANGWSGATFISPTFNTNKITLSTTSNGQFSGIGTSSSVDTSSSGFKVITTGTSSLSGFYCTLGTYSQKNFATTYIIGSHVNVTTNTLTITSHGTGGVTSYPVVYSQSGQKSEVYALWFD